MCCVKEYQEIPPFRCMNIVHGGVVKHIFLSGNYALLAVPAQAYHFPPSISPGDGLLPHQADSTRVTHHIRLVGRFIAQCP